MRVLSKKSEPERRLDTVTDSLAAIGSEHRGTLMKAALVAGGLAALTAGSAAISSLRRRLESDS